MVIIVYLVHSHNLNCEPDSIVKKKAQTFKWIKSDKEDECTLIFNLYEHFVVNIVAS